MFHLVADSQFRDFLFAMSEPIDEVQNEVLGGLATGAALAGGVQGSGPPPPATARTTCEIRLNPRTFFMVRGCGGQR